MKYPLERISEYMEVLNMRLSSAWARRHPHIPAPHIRVLASSLCVSDHKFYCVFFLKRFLGHLDKLFCLLEQLKIFVAENGICASSQHNVSTVRAALWSTWAPGLACRAVHMSRAHPLGMRSSPPSTGRTSRAWPSKSSYMDFLQRD